MTYYKTKLIALLLSTLFLLSGCSGLRDTFGTPDSAPLSPGNQSTDTGTGEDVVYQCTLFIDCSSVFSQNGSLDPALSALLPEDGVILSRENIPFRKGESVGELLRRVCDEENIALERAGGYVEGIAHLYELDMGSGSGWIYFVNGSSPNISAASYILSPGDLVEWKYTCDFGADIGGNVPD